MRARESAFSIIFTALIIELMMIILSKLGAGSLT